MDHTRQALTAERLLRMRALRWDYFRGDIFDEHGWNALLILFIAEARGRSMTGAQVVTECGAPENVGSSWLLHLSAEQLIREDEGNVMLTDTTRAELSEYLTQVTHMFNDSPDPVAGQSTARA